MVDSNLGLGSLPAQPQLEQERLDVTVGIEWRLGVVRRVVHRKAAIASTAVLFELASDAIEQWHIIYRKNSDAFSG